MYIYLKCLKQNKKIVTDVVVVSVVAIAITQKFIS